MAIDFPGSPSVNDTFTSGSLVYTFDGTKWTAEPAGVTGGTKIEVSNTKAEIIDTGSDGRFVVTTEGSERLRVTSAGRMGLGTASPQELVEIRKDAAGADAVGMLLHNQNSGANTAIGITFAPNTGGFTRAAGVYGVNETTSQNATALTFRTNANGASGTEKARIDSSGRLLVGTTTSRSRQLFVKGGAIANTTADTTSTNTVISKFDALNNPSNDTGRFAAIEFATDPSTWFYGDIRFITNDSDGTANAGAERMRVNSAGELLIGYTTDNGAYKLQVNSQIFATSATVATSDGRYKENVASLGGCLDLVKALRPVSFTWKPQEDITRTDDDGNEVLVREGHNFPEGTQVGFIAQEVQEVLTDKPWLNSVIKENVRPAVLDDEGNELAPEEQFFGIAEGNLIAVLTNALQEAVAQIETLTDRVAALESQQPQ